MNIQILQMIEGAKFFDKSQNDVFPEADFHMCPELDKFNFVLRLKKDANGLSYMEKI